MPLENVIDRRSSRESINSVAHIAKDYDYSDMQDQSWDDGHSEFPRGSGDLLKLLVLSNQQSKTQIYIIYNKVNSTEFSLFQKLRYIFRIACE